MQRSLHKIVAKRFELSIYFGWNLAERHAAEPRAVQPVPGAADARQFRSPRRRAGGGCRASRPIPVGDVPRATGRSCARRSRTTSRGAARRPRRPHVQYAHDLAILANDDERSPPSNREALKRFERAARAQGFDVEIIDRDDYGRIAEFDALFIRETTAVNHHTYRFARRARAEGWW